MSMDLNEIQAVCFEASQATLDYNTASYIHYDINDCRENQRPFA